MVFAEFDGLVPLAHVVIESADIQLVTSMLVTHDALVLVRVVEPLDRRVAFSAFDAFRAQIPSNAVYESFAVLRRILENVRRSSEISGVMRKVTTLGVVRVLLGRTPACLVVEHEEDVAFLLLIQVNQVLVQGIKVQQAFRHEVIFDAFVLEITVDGLDVLQVLE